MNLHTLAALFVLPAVLVGTTVTFDEPDFQMPVKEFVIRYSADELAAELAARESFERLARDLPVLCSFPFTRQNIVYLQKRGEIAEWCR